MYTIWTEGEKISYPALERDLKKDIVIVGGGIAGYLTAFRLSECGKDVALLEAKELFSGTTNKTTAHIDALQTLLYSLLSKKSLKKAKLYFESQQRAVDEYEKLINKYNIDCKFIRHNSYIIANNADKKFLKEVAALKKMGIDVFFEDNAIFSGESALGVLENDNLARYPKLSGNKAIIYVPSMAAFDPILFLKGLPVNFDIYENTKVTEVDFSNKQLKANGHTVTANKIVIATNFPIINFPGWYFVRMYRSTSYAIAAKSQPLQGIYQSVSESGMTFRSYKDYLIVGGLDHKTGRQDDTKKYEKLYQKAQEIMPVGEMTHFWSANDCITFDNVPFVGYYSKKSKDIYVITGFNKYGMANAMTASMLICDYINKSDNKKIITNETAQNNCTCSNVEKYKELFTPQRHTSILGFLRNFVTVAKNLLIMPLTIPFKSWKSLKRGEGDIVRYKGKKRAVYIDEQGKPHICSPLCAHLKCQLKFNKIEKTWDCPCHGSRFDVDGNLLVGPAVNNLKNYKEN